MITGSYRREAKFCSDVDLVYLKPTNDDEKILDKIKNILEKKLDGSIEYFAEGKTRIAFYFTPKNMKNSMKVDLYMAEKKYQIPFFIVYTTGNKIFNLVMRHREKKKGFLLNQNGLYDRSKKLVEKSKKVKNEKDVFKLLNLEYVEPKDRNYGKIKYY